MEIKLSSNPDYHPIMQPDPYVSSNTPSLGSSRDPGHPCSNFVIPRGGKPAWGVHRPWCRDLPCANRMGKHAYQAHFDGKIELRGCQRCSPSNGFIFLKARSACEQLPDCFIWMTLMNWLHANLYHNHITKSLFRLEVFSWEYIGKQ